MMTAKDNMLKLIRTKYGSNATLQSTVQHHLDKLLGEDLVEVPNIDAQIPISGGSREISQSYPDEQPIVHFTTYISGSDYLFVDVYVSSISYDSVDYAFAIEIRTNNDRIRTLVNKSRLSRMKQELKTYKELKQTTGGLQDIFDL